VEIMPVAELPGLDSADTRFGLASYQAVLLEE
jgi:hypothetical protein